VRGPEIAGSIVWSAVAEAHGFIVRVAGVAALGILVERIAAISHPS
jgi:hypothetical protein